jgi:IS1 family transposase
MNILSTDRQAAVLRSLVEGNSIRATARMTGVARETVANLLRDVGAHCKNYHDRFVTGISTQRIELDEIWSFIGKKERRVLPEEIGQGKGDIWTWVGMDSDTKLVIGYRVGDRDHHTGFAFVDDLADRIDGRVQISTDGFAVYHEAISQSFGWERADYARIIKVFGPVAEGMAAARRYSPPQCIAVEKQRLIGQPDMSRVSTSHAERQNLTMRMSMRRFTRLTNAFSKKAEYHLYAVALHFMHYNFCRPHMTLSKAAGRPITPAMAAGKADSVWTAVDLLKLLQSN